MTEDDLGKLAAMTISNLPVGPAAESQRPLPDLVEQLRPYDPDLVVHDPGGPAECVVRGGELLVAADKAELVRDGLRRWVDGEQTHDQLGVTRLRLRPAERGHCVELAAEAATAAGTTGPSSVQPNHVHFGSPVLHGTPLLQDTPAPVGPELDRPGEPVPPAPADEVWEPAVTVAVLDTGLDPHPWFAGRTWFSEWGLSPEVLDADDDAGQDRHAGHGTFIAGILLQHAPGVTLRHQRVLSSLGITDDVTVMGGLRRVRRRAAGSGEHVHAVVLSSGCLTADNACPPLLRREVLAYRDATVVAAAGNLGSDRPFWPAALPEVLAVSAIDAAGRRPGFANHGPWVDAAAPGVDVASSFVQLRPGAGYHAPGTEHRRYGFARWSGTSFAAPRIAAELALLRRNGVTAEAARAEVLRHFPAR